jgi:dihydroorotate dehydrogenase electron transfer subunit
VKQFFAEIVSNRPVSGDLYQLDIVWDIADEVPVAGNFYTIRVSESTVPFLRRPFAFSGFNPDTRIASTIYKKRGKATEILAGKKAGESLDVIGILGNTFPKPPNGKRAILVAGGIGLGPIVFLARQFKNQGMDMLLIIGFRSEECIPTGGEIDALSPVVCTDDGSHGFGGTVVDYLKTCDEERMRNAVFYACGPMPMLKGCHEIARKYDTDCSVSMEQVMACGVGACMGCVVKTIHEGEYARVCKEGPVFSSREIAWT